ncbi:carbon-nitrogen family hydrolase [Thermoflavimicrobium daqui]|uniref:Carbon-nitrogen hydrolase n=1 Tax=Thermoflavimicrobium daqui TaxID=2137476 RepID=A0A364K0E3_9BACL|nr:carbon-nitrogen family hydrolase [Thermoflavimicrobium daqui]RAL20815.1 carbon-nitrogen hydrolase [Thermoflavimicrobium daqui]
MKIAICQMNIIQGNIDYNLRNAEEMIDEAVRNQAQVVVLPEMWKSGYDFARLQEHVESIDGPTRSFLSQKAKEHAIWLIGGSYTMEQEGQVYNTSLTFNRQGELVNVYSKLHLIGLMNEDQYLARGREYTTFDLNGHLASVIICYDLRFPELIRTYAVEGASILFVPAEWPVQREEHWLALLRARAIENQMYVVGANMAGQNENDHFNGRSIVFDPWGDVVCEAGTEPTILYAEVDLGLVESVRKAMPVFRDRVPNLYRL